MAKKQIEIRYVIRDEPIMTKEEIYDAIVFEETSKNVVERTKCLMFRAIGQMLETMIESTTDNATDPEGILENSTLYYAGGLKHLRDFQTFLETSLAEASHVRLTGKKIDE